MDSQSESKYREISRIASMKQSLKVSQHSESHQHTGEKFKKK
jgi:hypothetical protein